MGVEEEVLRIELMRDKVDMRRPMDRIGATVAGAIFIEAVLKEESEVCRV